MMQVIIMVDVRSRRGQVCTNMYQVLRTFSKTIFGRTTSTQVGQGLGLELGVVLWYPLSPVAALLLVASVSSSYLAGVFAGLDEWFSRSFGQKASGEKANIIKASIYSSTCQAPCASDLTEQNQ